MKQIPVIIISGFLGSGKTTLLCDLMKFARNRGLQYGILMNEVGKVDVDGSLVRAEDGQFSLEKLFDGCICCDKKSEIAASIMQLVERKPDVIFIELTGVANPEEIADSLMDPKLRRVVALKMIITVLDGELVLDYNSIFSADKLLIRTLRRQIEVADLIILNKTDLINEATTQKILKMISKHNSKSLPIMTTFSSIDPEIVLKNVTYSSSEATPVAEASSRSQLKVRPAQSVSVVKQQHKANSPKDTQRQKSYTRLQSLCLNGSKEAAITKKQLEAFVKQIPGQVLRIKGYLWIASEAKFFLFQFAGKQMNWDSSAAPYADDPYLVVIGIDLDETAINQAWERLQDS